ncbi:hypothetical protein AMS68_002277 [Peltaster fructicola]|uniref:Zn(2)-C6 fungal-type domain-containing protein n=1 Tax=Peltaster fructicola TaxID=286661 RepID=A0A6H0XQK8_9PEZI|nr:hypothetical protein AMS68_002277 [Peltaster fructicola]
MAHIQTPDNGTIPMDDRCRVKRRGLRKGTHSCWECKRRKMRCVADASVTRGPTVCQGCRRRGSACVSQEVPEEIAFGIINADVGDGAVTLSTDAAVNNPLTPASTVSRQSGRSSNALGLENISDGLTKTRSTGSTLTVSEQLYAALPSLDDMRRIQHVCTLPDISAYELMTMPYATLSQRDRPGDPSQERSWTTLSQVGTIEPHCHPVVIARHMLMLASALQHLDPARHTEIRGLSERPHTIAERLSRVANQHVTSRDEMLGSIEALECVLIESVYQANLGNLRHSWILARRAVSVAQLMGLDRPDQRAQYQVLDDKRPHNLRTMWRRIVFLDRFLCIMLGLPPACPDSSWAQTTAVESSTGERLERIHCMVASRILQTGVKELTATDRQQLQSLDTELQKAVRSLPARWWLIPRLDASQTDPRTMFWNTGRIFAQVLHYNLVYRLHLPYVFRTSPTDHTYEYSRMTCANASREILTRFLALRAFNGIASSCRIIDFIALMAALTLLLSHLHLQASATENFLAHQYHTDRAMIEQVYESMKEAHQFKSDPLSARSADLLGRLMAIDTYEADGFLQNTKVAHIHPGAEVHKGGDAYTRATNGTNEHAVIPNTEDNDGCPGNDHGISGVPGICSTENDNHHLRNSHTINVYPGVEGVENDDEHSVSIQIPYFGLIKISRNANLNLSSSRVPPVPDYVAPQDVYPGLAADLEDWAFQGVDLALLDTIMQSIENNEADSANGENT